MKRLLLVFLFSTAAAGCEMEEMDAEFDEVAALDEGDVGTTEQEISQSLQLGVPYQIQNVRNGLCLDLPWGSNASGTRINQYHCHQGPVGWAQTFRLQAGTKANSLADFQIISEESYRQSARRRGSAMCITQPGKNGGSLFLYRCNASGVWGNQDIVQGLSAYYNAQSLVFLNGYNCMDVPNGSFSSGVQMQSYERCHYWGNQSWRFIPLPHSGIGNRF